MTGSREDRLFFKWCAKRAMGEKGNLLRFIGATFIMLALCNALLYAYDVICLFTVGEYTFPLILGELFLLFLVAAPLFMGLRRMAYLMAMCRETELADILYFFGKKRLGASYLISLVGVFRLAFTLVISFCLGKGAAVYVEGYDSYFFSDLSVMLTCVAFLLLFGASGRLGLLSAAYFEQGSLGGAWRMSRGKTFSALVSSASFTLSFIPLMLLSVLTLGILFFVYILPLYMIGRRALSAYILGIINKENFRK